MTSNDHTSPTRLSLTARPTALESFCLLTGGGFKIRVKTGESVKDLLCGQLGIDTSYFDCRIATIFLDSSAVDDPETAVVSAGATLALSAAMPGVAGAMLRSGGHYSPMRSAISHDARSTESTGHREADITLKLFNMLQLELGPAFLERGIRLPGAALADLFKRRGRKLRSLIEAAEIDGQTVGIDDVLNADWQSRWIELQVTAAGQYRN